MKTISKILLLVMYLYSCTSTRMIKHDQSDYNGLNEKLKEQYAEIKLLNGDVKHGFDVNVGIDSTSWFETKKSGKEQVRTDVEQTVPTMEIIKIDVGNTGRGAREGLKNGFLIGAAIGVGLIFTQLNLDSTSVGFKSLLFIPVCAVGGAIIGIPYGMISMGTEEYVLTKSPPDSTIPTVPLKVEEVIDEEEMPVRQSDGY